MRYLVFLLIACLPTVLLGQDKKDLSPEEFEKAISRPGQQVLDVRTAAEYQQGHIKEALQADWLKKEQFMERVHYVDKNKPVYVYCASGPRSTAAAKWLRENGYGEVYELKGGFIKWKSEGKPLKEAAKGAQQMSVQDYDSLVKTSPVMLIDFGAEWCPPCKKMEPVLAEIQKELPGKFNRLNIDPAIHTELARTMNAENLPTLILYKQGKEVWRGQGILEAETVKKAILSN
jgi:rhodanese-related sulfurtransferase